MKKHIGLLSLLFCGLLIPLIGNSAWLLINKSITTIQAPIKNAVCMSPDGGGMYYSSIEDGLRVLNKRAKDKNSSQLLYVLPEQDITINNDVTIGEDVTMIIPFKTKDRKNNFDETCYKRPNHSGNNANQKYTNKTTGPIDVNNTQINEFRKTRITLGNGVKLSIEHNVRGKPNGKLIVGAEYGECGVNGYYSEITLNKGASIYNAGTLECYGYIKEKYYPEIDQKTDTRCIDNYHSSLITPMAVYDFPYSGSNIQAIYNNNICLINSYDFPCLQTMVHLDSYVDFAPVLHIHRSAAGSNIQFDKSVSIINSDVNQEALFRYDPNKPGESQGIRDTFKLDIEYIKDYSKEYTYLGASKSIYTNYDIYGKCNIGSIYLELDANYKIDTKKYFLPISYRMNITLKKGATFGIGYKVKFLPGSKLKVETGANLNLMGSANIYKKNAVKKMKNQRYATTMDDAYFCVNGALYLGTNGKIGGTIVTEDLNGNAKIDLRDATNIDNLYCASGEGIYNDDVCYEAQGIVYKPPETIAQNGIERAVCNFPLGTQIHSNAWLKDSSGKYVSSWKWNETRIPYVYKINVNDPKQFEHTVYSYDIIKEVGTNKTQQIYDLNCTDELYYCYCNYDERIQINVNRNATAKSLKPEFTFQNHVLQTLKCDPEIEITPGKAFLLSVTEDKVENPSGRGTVVTIVSESIDWDGTNGTWTIIAKFSGSLGEKVVYGPDGKPVLDSNGNYVKEPIKIGIAANKYIKIQTIYNHWQYSKETIQVGSQKEHNYQEENNWVIYTSDDVTLHRYGGSVHWF